MHEDDDSLGERLCYCAQPISKHARELHELKTRKIRCHLLQSEIAVFQAYDDVRGALHV